MANEHISVFMTNHQEIMDFDSVAILDFLVCSLENLYFQYDEIVSISKLPFHNPLVMNITTF